MTLENDDVLESFRGMTRCEDCKKHKPCCGHHYWVMRGAGGGTRVDHPFNLISLCDDCHRKAHDKPSRYRLRKIVAAREDVTEQTIFEFLTWLARQDRNRLVGRLT